MSPNKDDIFYHVPIKSFFSDEFNTQYYICPNCLEVIENDTCLICGCRFIIEMQPLIEKPEIEVQVDLLESKH